ncbi:MAG: alanine racemase [Hyphomonas sp.]|uniref:alanine racemase n=1 Tax=Hyphomonas sp. TaxID=87 RepID=UPI0034A01BFF
MLELSRRNLMIGGAGLLGAGLLMSKPGDESGPRDPYFLELQAALMEAGIASPTLIVDKARLNANIDTLIGHLPAGMAYRIVAKSLPSLDLIAHIRKRSGSGRLMTFNQPMLTALSRAMPEADQLLGKPLPVAAARNYFSSLAAGEAPAAARVQWLVDTPERLRQYQELAAATGQTLRINLELDVGLHRGGLEAGDTLKSMLETLRDAPEFSFAGFVGYEPHLAALPEALGWRDRARSGAWRRYGEALMQAAEVSGADAVSNLVRNAAGSPTYRYYQDTEVANEISAGSCLVKPTHFDTPLLEPHLPASFIAAPVIKSLAHTRLPGLEFAAEGQRAWDPNTSRTVFIHGGNWLADPVDPPGLSYNKTFGRSSNQEMLTGGHNLAIAPDEFVFLRPHQSEAVFLQFGDIAVFEDGRITERWPVFEASA